MKRVLALLLVLFLLPSAALCGDWEDWDEDEDWDWRTIWEEEGLFEYADLKDGVLTVFEGVTTLGMAVTDCWDPDLEEFVDVEPKFEDGPSFGGEDGSIITAVCLPSTLRFLGYCAFEYHDLDTFTLPAQLEVIEPGALTYCSIGTLRVESVLPAEDILAGLYDCWVTAYEVPEDHPLYKSVDGILLTRDGKTLLSYPNARKDTHFDVPAGVERIEEGAISSEYLKTVSLPIGLRSIGDYAFSGCSRLQSVVLPLTVSEIGEDIFLECVSLELVSLPGGVQADKTNEKWVEYYQDDVIFRGDNGDTLGGARSTGKVSMPGRLCVQPENSRSASRLSKSLAADYVLLYNSPEDDELAFDRMNTAGRVVYMGEYRNGRVAVYEPLSFAGLSLWRAEFLGWADIADVQYLPPETLFEYAGVKPRGVMSVWWEHLPYGEKWVPWTTVIPDTDKEYSAYIFGPFVRFTGLDSQAAFACAIQDAELTRKPDGTANVYGIVYNTDILEDIPLLDGPGGEALKQLPGGTQVQVLEEKDGWLRVTDGRDTGWVGSGRVMIVPEKQKER